MLGMLQIYFKAPTKLIREWIAKVKAESHLSFQEREILNRANESLSQQELTNLYWYIEGIWALMWVGKLIDELPYDHPVSNSMASLCPAIHLGEDCSKFSSKMRVRPFDELFRQLDLYYRLHWYARDAKINGYDTTPVNLSVVTERRKALEWVSDRNVDWDNVEMST